MFEEKKSICKEIAKIYENLANELMKMCEIPIDEYPFVIEAARERDQMFMEAMNYFQLAKKYNDLVNSNIKLMIVTKRRLKRELSNLKK